MAPGLLNMQSQLPGQLNAIADPKSCVVTQMSPEI